MFNHVEGKHITLWRLRHGLHRAVSRISNKCSFCHVFMLITKNRFSACRKLWKLFFSLAHDFLDKQAKMEPAWNCYFVSGVKPKCFRWWFCRVIHPTHLPTYLYALPVYAVTLIWHDDSTWHRDRGALKADMATALSRYVTYTYSRFEQQ